MNAIHPFIMAVIVVGAFASLGVPSTMATSIDSFKVGGAMTALAMGMNAVFQWRDPSPLNLILMNDKSGTFETVLLSIGVAFFLRAIVGLVWYIVRSGK